MTVKCDYCSQYMESHKSHVPVTTNQLKSVDGHPVPSASPDMCCVSDLLHGVLRQQRRKRRQFLGGLTKRRPLVVPQFVS